MFQNELPGISLPVSSAAVTDSSSRSELRVLETGAHSLRKITHFNELLYIPVFTRRSDKSNFESRTP
jgi:hypothetical protein